MDQQLVDAITNPTSPMQPLTAQNQKQQTIIQALQDQLRITQNQQQQNAANTQQAPQAAADAQQAAQDAAAQAAAGSASGSNQRQKPGLTRVGKAPKVCSGEPQDCGSFRFLFTTYVGSVDAYVPKLLGGTNQINRIVHDFSKLPQGEDGMLESPQVSVRQEWI